MRLSAKAFSEMCLAARLVADVTGKNLECHGYLLADKGSDLIDSFCFPEQSGSDARVSVTSFHSTYLDAYEIGKYLVGMWHTHGAFPLFHSSTDYRHIENRLDSMRNMNCLLDTWKAAEQDGFISLQSKAGYRKKILLGKPMDLRGITATEIMPKDFYSIVINSDTCRDFDRKKVHAMAFRKDTELQNEEINLQFDESAYAAALDAGMVAEIGNNFSYGEKQLKDFEGFKDVQETREFAEGKSAGEKNTEKITGNIIEKNAEDNTAEIKSGNGHFVLAVETDEKAKELCDAIESVEDEPAKAVHNANKLENIVRKKQAFAEERQVAIEMQANSASDNPYSTSEMDAMEIHAVCARHFIGSMDFYHTSGRRYLEADKAVVDLFAALAGVFDASENKHEERLEKVNEVIARLGKSGTGRLYYQEMLQEAARIIEKGDYKGHCREKATAVAKKLKRKPRRKNA